MNVCGFKRVICLMTMSVALVGIGGSLFAQGKSEAKPAMPGMNMPAATPAASGAPKEVPLGSDGSSAASPLDLQMPSDPAASGGSMPMDQMDQGEMSMMSGMMSGMMSMGMGMNNMGANNASMAGNNDLQKQLFAQLQTLNSAIVQLLATVAATPAGEAQKSLIQSLNKLLENQAALMQTLAAQSATGSGGMAASSPMPMM